MMDIKDVFFIQRRGYIRRVCVLASNMDRKLLHHIFLQLHQNCFPRSSEVARHQRESNRHLATAKLNKNGALF